MITINKKESKFTNSDTQESIILPSYQYEFELYTLTITVILGRKTLSKFNKLFSNPSCCAQCDNSWLKSNGEIILFFDSNKPKASIVAHECVHACDNILENIGYTHPNESNEITAYLVGHLVDVVYKVLKFHKEEK